MNKKSVDIICLVHNQLPVTRGFVKSLFSNTDEDQFNLIFVNNGSNTATTEYLESGQDKWVYVNAGKNLGVIQGRNLGIEYSKSDFFMNIDNDQYPKKGWLQKLFDLINKGYDIVGPEAWLLMPPNKGGATVVCGQSMPDRSYFPIKHCQHIFDKFSYIGCGGSLIRRKVYEKIGLFDDIFSPAYFEDPDFTWRAMQAGFKIGWCHDCPIEHLAHQTFNFQKLFDKNEQFIKSWSAFRSKWHPFYPDPLCMVKK